jgi:carboxypeptidase C (cathepsin A)
LPAYTKTVEAFALGPYASALSAFPKIAPDVLRTLSEYVGIPPAVLRSWRLDVSTGYGTVFLTSLLLDDGLAVGAYDGRVTADDTGIAGAVDPNSGGNDPTITAVGGVYTAMWNIYLNDELQFTATSPFLDLNDQAFLNWNFGHIDPTGAERGGMGSLYSAGDLAAAMALNPYLKVFSANGYYDAVTPFFQTVLNFEHMPLVSPQARSNLTIRHYPSGHMIYLDNESRTGMKSDLTRFYESAAPSVAAVEARAAEPARPLSRTEYRRRINRVRY